MQNFYEFTLFCSNCQLNCNYVRSKAVAITPRDSDLNFTENALSIISLNKSGKIKTRIFALVLLMLSCSMLIAAYRSISREFSGMVVKRTTTVGVTSNQYFLHLKSDLSNLSRAEIINTLTENARSAQRFGVSAVVYEKAQLFEHVAKNSFSVFISVGGENFFDLGLLWMLMGFGGLAISLFMHYQTMNPRTGARYQSEDIDVPGLE
ncbi:MAG: hypothetical protein CVV41_15405 [Candidatus Riflebacteria bacterium HGW-Riflebacteria-1]|nr:MAG: hypothetical protein CVV41_15405 [Candidatus Riflebacteria bacterium HGW-Riflebacteria-1]